MAIRIPIWDPNQELIVKYEGLMDMDGLYKRIHTWFINRKFEPVEKVFKDKSRQEGREEQIKIDGFRNDDPQFRVWVNVYIHTWNMNKVEVVVDGKKKMMEKGRFKITIRADFEVDYENRWERSKFTRALLNFYIKYLIYRKLTVYGDKIEYEGHKLQELIKGYLGMGAAGDQYADMW
ncbi:MAG: hypothetical protein V1735_06240 [Nanoarchaeota archaeon]